MPAPPSQEVAEPVQEVILPVVPVQTVDNTESEEDGGMDKPLFDVKGELLSPPKPPETPIVLKKIDVVANSAGFYGQQRRADGDKFTIEGEHEFAWWMTRI